MVDALSEIERPMTVAGWVAVFAYHIGICFGQSSSLGLSYLMADSALAWPSPVRRWHKVRPLQCSSVFLARL